MEAGCKKKAGQYENGVAIKYNWTAAGQLLATGICIKDNYKKYFPPDDGNTMVYSTIENLEVREVHAKRRTISVDFTLTNREVRTFFY